MEEGWKDRGNTDDKVDANETLFSSITTLAFVSLFNNGVHPDSNAVCLGTKERTTKAL